MIIENEAPARSSEVPPPTLQDAVGRVTEYAVVKPPTGLINMVFVNLIQLETAMHECGFVTEIRPLMENDLAQTYHGTIELRNTRYNILLHSFGDKLRVLNVEPAIPLIRQTPQPVKRLPWET